MLSRMYVDQGSTANPWGIAGRSRCVLNGKELPKTGKFFPAVVSMSTKSQHVLFGSRIAGAKIRAEGARERAKQAVRAADRAEGEAWSIRMEGYFGPAQPSPTIAQCLNSGLGWLEVECKRCKTRASLPLDAIRRPRDTPIWKLEAALKCRSCKKGRYAPPAHDQAGRNAGDHAVPLGASGRGAMTPWSFKR